MVTGMLFCQTSIENIYIDVHIEVVNIELGQEPRDNLFSKLALC